MIRHIVLTYDCSRNCPYCYANNQKEMGEMAFEQFKKLLDWFKERNIKKFSLIGGEPTQYTYFDEVNTSTSDFYVTLLTNGLFKEKPTNNISAFVVNCNLPETYTKDELNVLELNIKKMRDKSSDIVLRHNILDYMTPYGFIINLCNKYNIKNISYSIATPNSSKSNKFTKLNNLDKLKQNIISFVETCNENGIKVKMSRPVPFCLFNNPEREFMQKRGGLIGTCSPTEGVYVINPDMSVYPCSSMHFKGQNIFDFNNEKEIIKFYLEKINKLKWRKFLFAKCRQCIHLKRKKCHGGCLTYKIESDL